MSKEDCFICGKEKSKYVCPRCNIPYCSVACYKAKEHLECSEEFYKKWILEEMKINDDIKDTRNQRKMYEILKRMRDLDAGLNDGQLNDCLDSDDDLNDGEQLNLIDRLQDVDINNAEEVWQCLTEKERDEFKNLIESGDIMNLLPEYQPWWLKNKAKKKIIELPLLNHSNDDDNEDEDDNENIDEQHIPKLYEKIPNYAAICKKSPSPCLQYNLYNILKSYACTLRYFRGEEKTNANEATAYFINLCITLKYGANFDSIEDAIESVDIEAKTTGKGALTLMGVKKVTDSLIASHQLLDNDLKHLMSSTHYKLAALSDLLSLFNLTKKQLKQSTTSKEGGEFQKLFALCCGMEEITPNKLSKFIKKLEFYLAYIQKENDMNSFYIK